MITHQFVNMICTIEMEWQRHQRMTYYEICNAKLLVLGITKCFPLDKLM